MKETTDIPEQMKKDSSAGDDPGTLLKISDLIHRDVLRYVRRLDAEEEANEN